MVVRIDLSRHGVTLLPPWLKGGVAWISGLGHISQKAELAMTFMPWMMTQDRRRLITVKGRKPEMIEERSLREGPSRLHAPTLSGVTSLYG